MLKSLLSQGFRVLGFFIFKMRKEEKEMYQIIEVKDMNIEEAVALCKQEYMEEQQKTKIMPPMDREMEELLAGVIHQVKGAPYGKALIEEGKLAGFLAFFGPWEGFHGVGKGVFSPLGASAFAGEKSGKVASLLFQAVAEELVEDKVFGVAMSRYTYNEEVNKTLCLNSFGIRCSDAILSLQDYVLSDKDPEITIVELRGEEKLEIKELYERLKKHLTKSPCFFPTQEGEAQRWFENQKIRILAARENSKVIGYMAIDDEAETFLTERTDISNICGAYVSEEYRSQGVAKQLLDAVVEKCIEEGKRYLGVDYETINPTALHFWTKYFVPYTYSFIRRIDERI